MTGVFELIFYLIESVYHILKEDFVITVYTFSFSLWDFFITLFLLSLIVPLVVSNNSISFSNLSRWFTRNSERNKSKKDEDS